MRKILCDDPEFPVDKRRVFCYVLDDGTLDMKREGGKHRVTVIGESFTMIGSNTQGGGKTIVEVKNGVLVEDNLSFKGEKNGEEQPITSEQPKDTDPAKVGTK